jgi:hypothetical protein
MFNSLVEEGEESEGREFEDSIGAGLTRWQLSWARG